MNPSDYLKPGLTREQDFTVEETHTASHIGSGAVKVLATPWMIAYMEITARALLDEHLPQGYSSVGTRVEVCHLAPSALGGTVRAKAAIEGVEGSQVRLAVAVWEGAEQIGAGSHERFVIDVERFLKRVGRAG